MSATDTAGHATPSTGPAGSNAPGRVCGCTCGPCNWDAHCARKVCLSGAALTGYVARREQRVAKNSRSTAGRITSTTSLINMINTDTPGESA